MLGETLALLAAVAYGCAGVSIVHSKTTAQGDNGVFLSVVITLIASGVLWLGWGTTSAVTLKSAEGLWAAAFFALAGFASNIFGRQAMYRATEKIGAVRAGLLRRLIPVFALPCAYMLLSQIPNWRTVLGGAIVIAGVVFYMRPSLKLSRTLPSIGVVLGLLSAAAYALAYCLRAAGLHTVPDAALGTLIGASIAVVWFMNATMVRHGVRQGFWHLTSDRTPAHWRTAIALSAGQLLQFFALKFTSVATVAILGSLEVLFSATLVLLVSRCEAVEIKKLLLASAFAALGTALLVVG